MTPIRRLLLPSVCLTAALTTLLISPLVQADAERLQAALDALPAEYGEISEPWLREEVNVSDLNYQLKNGEWLRIDQYRLIGSLDNPNELLLESVRIESEVTAMPLMTAERIRIIQPSHALLPAETPFSAEGLEIDGLVIDLPLDEQNPSQGRGRIRVDQLRAEELDSRGIGALQLRDIAGEGSALGDLGEGSFQLESLRLTGLSGLDSSDDQEIRGLLLENLSVDSDHLIGGIEEALLDNDLSDGEGGLWIKALQIDLNRSIGLAPPEERTQLRMISNVLTDGSGQLALDIAIPTQWTQHAEFSLIKTGARIDASDILSLALDAELPMTLDGEPLPPPSVQDSDELQNATLLGGQLRLLIQNDGLFQRLTTLGAALQATTEPVFLEQLRVQATALGMPFGQQVQATLLGLVAMMDGSASELEISLSLPAQSDLGTYTQDPLALPDKLSLDVIAR